MDEHTGILIVGGGLAGVSLALALAGQGLRLCLVDGLDAEHASDYRPYDDRAIALSWGSRRILEGLEIWPSLAAQAAPIRHIHVSERGGFGATRLDATDHGLPALGYVLTAGAIGQALWSKLASCSNGDIEILRPATLMDFQLQGHGVHCTIRQGGRLIHRHATLLAAADGAHSMVRHALAIPLHEHDYAQLAVVCSVRPLKPRPGFAFEGFTDSGPLALLPLLQDRMAVVWTANAQDTASMLAWPDATFLQRLSERFGQRLGAFADPSPRRAYPLRLVLSQESWRPRVALLGNAAHTLHPVAGQGFNLGLRDLAALVEVVLDAHRQGHDIGSPAVLERYGRWRDPDQRRIATLTDALVRLFTNPLPGLACARSLGLLGLDRLPPAKHAFSRLLLGGVGPLPRLARGLAP